MTDQLFNDEKSKVDDKREYDQGDAPKSDYREETAAEFTPGLGAFGRDTVENDRPRTFARPDRDTEEGTGGKVMGTIALVLSLLSLFYAPIFWGGAGIIVGFIARNRGANGLGNWAIGIGVVSIVINLFIAPFFY